MDGIDAVLHVHAELVCDRILARTVWVRGSDEAGAAVDGLHLGAVLGVPGGLLALIAAAAAHFFVQVLVTGVLRGRGEVHV